MKVKVGDTVSVSTHDMSYVRVLGVVKHIDGVQYEGSRKELAFVEFVGRVNNESGWFTEAELAVVVSAQGKPDLDKIEADYAMWQDFPIQMTGRLVRHIPELLAEIRAYRHAESMQADDFGFR